MAKTASGPNDPPENLGPLIECSYSFPERQVEVAHIWLRRLIRDLTITGSPPKPNLAIRLAERGLSPTLTAWEGEYRRTEDLNSACEWHSHAFHLLR